MSTWRSFGDRNRFGFDFRFLPDPHKGRAATPEQSASWGAFRIWFRGENLCEHRAQGELQDAVTWYLLPLFQWLLENWDPLLHEQRFPEGVQARSARHGYVKAVKATLGDPDPAVEARAVAWQQWWRRHSLRSCREGGLFPHLFIRRVLDYVELSWGNQTLPGTPTGFYFTVPANTAYASVPDIATPLYQALVTALDELQRKAGDSAEIVTLTDRLNGLVTDESQHRRDWYLFGRNSAYSRETNSETWLKTRLDEITATGEALFQGVDTPLFVEHLSPAVAMFGSLSPNIGPRDADRLVMELLAAHERDGESNDLAERVEDLPLSDTLADYDEGYDLALDLLEDLGLPKPQVSWIDLTAVLARMGITTKSVALDDPNVRGVALAGGDIRPTILVNPCHPMNASEAGQRFTVAHELCHILYDRGFGNRLSIASGPWAPHGIERRANAFAAMFLMPPELVNRVLARSANQDIASLGGVKVVSAAMRTGVLATLEHLVNIGKVDEERREVVGGVILGRVEE